MRNETPASHRTDGAYLYVEQGAVRVTQLNRTSVRCRRVMSTATQFSAERSAIDPLLNGVIRWGLCGML